MNTVGALISIGTKDSVDAVGTILGVGMVETIL